MTRPYQPAAWLPGPHAMTVFASVARPTPRPAWRRERWELPDGDFLDVDRLPPPAPDAPLGLICHGLEGSSQASYVRGLAAALAARGFGVAALNFRGCSGEMNRLPRFYHSGETGDLDHAVRRLADERPGRALVAAGFSLGANVVAKYLGERGAELPRELRAGAVVSVPWDLAASAKALDGPGAMAWLYRERFLRRLRRKAAEKGARFPASIDAAAAARAETVVGFDDAVTAPLHGFASAADYYARSSAGRYLAGVRLPLLAINALDDPMVPRASLPSPAACAGSVRLELTERGGHVAFVEGSPWCPRYWAEARVADWLLAATTSNTTGEGAATLPGNE
jgi:predicted alpha/beta-fold hydrolase